MQLLKCSENYLNLIKKYESEEKFNLNLKISLLF